MIRALRTGNYSVVIGWLADELTAEEHERLVIAARDMQWGLSCGRLEIRTSWETTQRAKNSLNLYH
jgi:cell division inhibitor SulA